jgi:hypothetical protein
VDTFGKDCFELSKQKHKIQQQIIQIAIELIDNYNAYQNNKIVIRNRAGVVGKM